MTDEINENSKINTINETHTPKIFHPLNKHEISHTKNHKKALLYFPSQSFLHFFSVNF